MTYNELINRFTIYDNPPKKKGYDRHHIVPTCEQKKLYGKVTDNRQIYVSLPMHMWLHILYDRENGTKTAKRFLDICRNPAEFFTCYELCLAYSYTLRKKKEEQFRKSAETHKNIEVRERISESMKGKNTWMKGRRLPEETKKKMSTSMKGKNTWSKGQKWFNDGIKSVMAYECPEGFVEGRLYQRRAGR